MPLPLAGIAGGIKFGGSIIKGIGGIFGGGQKTGPMWNRLDKIRVGEAETQGGAAVDEKYAKLINWDWERDIFYTQTPTHSRVWGPMAPGTFELVLRRHGKGTTSVDLSNVRSVVTAAQTAPASVSLAGIGGGNNLVLLLAGAAVVGAFLFMRKGSR